MNQINRKAVTGTIDTEHLLNNHLMNFNRDRHNEQHMFLFCFGVCVCIFFIYTIHFFFLLIKYWYILCLMSSVHQVYGVCVRVTQSKWNDNQIIVPVNTTFSEVLSIREYAPVFLDNDIATVLDVNKALEAKKLGRKRRPPWELWRLVGQCTVNPSLEINLLRKIFNRFKTPDQHVEQDRLDSDLGADVEPGKLYIFFYVPITSSTNSRTELSADATMAIDSDLPNPRTHNKRRKKRRRKKKRNVTDEEEEEVKQRRRRRRRRRKRHERKSKTNEKDEEQVQEEEEEEEGSGIVDPIEQVEIDFSELSSEGEEEEEIDPITS